MNILNSAGGYRIYPSRLDVADVFQAINNLTGQFNEGIDRLDRAQEVTHRETDLISNLSHLPLLTQEYQYLLNLSHWLQNEVHNIQEEIAHRDFDKTASYISQKDSIHRQIAL